MRIAPIVKEFNFTSDDQTGYNAITQEIVHNMNSYPFKHEAMFYNHSDGMWYTYRTGREFTLYSAFLGFDCFPKNANSIYFQTLATGYSLGNGFKIRLRLYFM